MNFEHNKHTTRLAAHAHYIATKTVAATDPQHVRWELDTLRPVIRRITDNTGSAFVGGRVGKYRNFRFWTETALTLARSGQVVTRRLHGDHAIEAKMLADAFVKAVADGLTMEEATAWFASHITVVTMLHGEQHTYKVNARKHGFTFEQLVADPFSRYPAELRATISDMKK